jgi:hypothetical protein
MSAEILAEAAKVLEEGLNSLSKEDLSDLGVDSPEKVTVRQLAKVGRFQLRGWTATKSVVLQFLAELGGQDLHNNEKAPHAPTDLEAETFKVLEAPLKDGINRPVSWLARTFRAPVDVPKLVYAVPWIEVESGWGSRPEGYFFYRNLEDCLAGTLLASKEGFRGGDYLGPVRPLHYVEVPFDYIPAECQSFFKLGWDVSNTGNYWEPEMSSRPKDIR